MSQTNRWSGAPVSVPSARHWFSRAIPVAVAIAAAAVIGGPSVAHADDSTATSPSTQQSPDGQIVRSAPPGVVSTSQGTVTGGNKATPAPLMVGTTSLCQYMQNTFTKYVSC